MTTLAQPAAYDRLARAYGCLTAGYDNDGWMAALVELARDRGLRGTRALDVACGTGSTSLPLAHHGFEVTGVDCSEGMLEIARERLAGIADLIHGDMRTLPHIGAFDLVTCVGDALNHLLDAASVERALERIACNLAPGGLLVFDLNTLTTLRSVFSASSVAGDASCVVVWRGLGAADLAVGGQTAAELTVVDLLDRMRPPETVVVEERHHPLGAVIASVRRAGLEPVAVRGSLAGARLDSGAPDEDRHHKLVVIAGRGGDRR